MTLINILLVGAGGFLGSIARYVTVVFIDRKMNSVFPYGTLAVNVLGSFALGFLIALLMKKSGAYHEQWKLLVGTGFCGGFTTFSAFAVENLNLFQQRLTVVALVYITFSLIAGLLAVWAGFTLGRNLV